jgi:hypothetical protein
MDPMNSSPDSNDNALSQLLGRDPVRLRDCSAGDAGGRGDKE